MVWGQTYDTVGRQVATDWLTDWIHQTDLNISSFPVFKVLCISFISKMYSSTQEKESLMVASLTYRWNFILKLISLEMEALAKICYGLKHFGRLAYPYAFAYNLLQIPPEQQSRQQGTGIHDSQCNTPLSVLNHLKQCQ